MVSIYFFRVLGLPSLVHVVLLYVRLTSAGIARRVDLITGWGGYSKEIVIAKRDTKSFIVHEVRNTTVELISVCSPPPTEREKGMVSTCGEDAGK